MKLKRCENYGNNTMLIYLYIFYYYYFHHFPAIKKLAKQIDWKIAIVADKKTPTEGITIIVNF